MRKADASICDMVTGTSHGDTVHCNPSAMAESILLKEESDEA